MLSSSCHASSSFSDLGLLRPRRVSDADPTADKATAAKSVSVAVADAASSGVSPTAEGAPKSSWEKAERARIAAASLAVREPASVAGGTAATAKPPERPAKSKRVGASIHVQAAGEEKMRDGEISADGQEIDDAAVMAAAAAAAAKAQAAGERRNDEERISAARERFLARKRKTPAAQ